MKKRKIILWIVISLVLLGLLIQLIPLPGRGHNPAVVAEPKWDNSQTAALVKRACYDMIVIAMQQSGPGTATWRRSRG